uniref:Uncharacterized protein n=1 Tax=Anguilla anguilla TaxID=7936 RepID=A0A0E9PU64_ANGAN
MRHFILIDCMVPKVFTFRFSRVFVSVSPAISNCDPQRPTFYKHKARTLQLIFGYKPDPHVLERGELIMQI